MPIPHVWVDVPCGTGGDDVWCCNNLDWKLRDPIVTKSILRIPTEELVEEEHVNGFGAFGNYGIVCDPHSGWVVCLEG